MKIKNHIILFLVLLAVWLLLNSSFEIHILSVGVVVSLIITLVFCRNCNVFSEIKLTPKSFFYAIIYVFVFSGALIKSNFDVARRVVTPSLPINPGIVTVKTKLKSKIGRLILANSITLTPGTLTIDIKDDILYIHWIDVLSTNIDEDTHKIVSRFEKYLEVIYG